jgi:branched-chain amino acid transport system ATP-binding protein
MTAMLRISDVYAGYGALQVLHGIDLDVREGEVVAILGSNGAGKSTLLRCLSGLRPFAGEIEFLGQSVRDVSPHMIVRSGLIQVPEARRVFSGLTVRENLLVGGTPLPDGSNRLKVLGEVFALFPILAERQQQIAGSMSGGQQQMLAIGRALMGRPKLLMLDEPSLGLAPLVIRELYEAIRRLINTGLTVLLVEQDINLALKAAKRAYVLENGRVVLQGPASELRENAHIKDHYLGL